MEALVYKSTGSWYSVKAVDGRFYNARIKGIFKIEGIISTNPVAVGDRVEAEMENEVDATVTITGISDRRNYIARSSPHQGKDRHIIASNLDQVLLFATLRDPKTSQGFIDRFLVAAEAYHVDPVIVFNKADIYRKKELELLKREKIYNDIGYKVILLSVQTGAGLDQVKKSAPG